MKLLFCTKCTDIFNLVEGREKSCSCGFTKGKYIDKLNAEYEGDPILLGLRSSQFIHSVQQNYHYGLSLDFTAFTINKDCKTFVKRK